MLNLDHASGRWVRLPHPPPSLAEASYGGHGPQVVREGEFCQMYYVYILICKDRKTYTGCTSNLKERIERHKSGKVLATKDRLPIKLLSYFAFSNKYKAFDFEKYLKAGSGRAFLKKRLI